MISSFISRIVILVFGTLYPAYASYKAVRTKNVKEYVKWMMYWIVFALFTCTETFTDLFFSFWFPFYYELKIITVIYLLSPATNGSSILYRKFVHPALAKREQEIDDYIAKAKEQGYHTMLNLGSKGVTYATTLLMQTAIKGGGGIVNQLRKSYSLSDLNEGRSLPQGREYQDEVDHRNYRDIQLVRRPVGSSPRQSLIEARDANLYFTEIDTFERNLNSTLYSPVLSAEENNSMGNSMHQDSQLSAGDRLVRTSSLGGTGRMRTRASSKATSLPDRSSVTEGGTTWSTAGEPYESQIKTDNFFFLPITHTSSSIPFPYAPVNHLASVDYQRLLTELRREQLFALLNSAGNPPKFFGDPVRTAEVENNEIEDSVQMEKAAESVDEEDKKSNESDNLKETTSEKDADSKMADGDGKAENPIGEKVSGERCGKYRKRPAPTPPAERENCKMAAVAATTTTDPREKDEDEFCTPDTSPVMMRKKRSSSYSNLIQEITDGDFEKEILDPEKNKYLDLQKKTKSKSGGKMSKKLHLPKISFNFWNQKSGKNLSGSENSSTENIAAEAENATTTTNTTNANNNNNNNNNLEQFISLKDEYNVNDWKDP